MSNLLKFPKATVNQALTHIEATTDGIRLDNHLVGYSSAIRQLDNGQFDRSLGDGLLVIADIQQGDTNGWFSPTDEEKAIIWRWLIACLFICEQQRANGTTDITNEDGSIDRAVIYAGEHGNLPLNRTFLTRNPYRRLAIENSR